MTFPRFFILLTLCLLLQLPVQLKAQDNQKSTEISLGTIKTDLKQNALSLSFAFSRSVTNLINDRNYLFAGENSLFMITPDISVQTGNSDAFSSISAKITGLVMLFDTAHVAGIVTPKTTNFFNTFPLSAGIETNNRFNIVNGIIEAGWVPWYQVPKVKLPKLLKCTKFGIFFQSGYKFSIDTTGNSAKGGQVDKSSEQVHSFILRTKGSLGFDSGSLLKISELSIGVAANADGWYDFRNAKTYYQLNGKIRFYLTPKQDKYFNICWQKGSGAPNFNTGTQYGMSLAFCI
jgi:hypothetical protein